MAERTLEHLLAESSKAGPSVIGWRRDFHKHAEVAWTELRNGFLIVRRLLDIGKWSACAAGTPEVRHLVEQRCRNLLVHGLVHEQLEIWCVRKNAVTFP